MAWTIKYTEFAAKQMRKFNKANRMDDYRIICKIERAELVVLVLRIGHRKDVYDE